MKYLLPALAIAFTAIGCGQVERKDVVSKLTIVSPGSLGMPGQSTTTYTTKCKEHEYSCNYQEISNSRTMHVGKGVYYSCGLNGKLYTFNRTSRSASANVLVDNTYCSYETSLN